MSEKQNDLEEDRMSRSKDRSHKILELKSKILEVQRDYLKALKEHYEDYLLDLDVRCYKAKMYSFVTKAEYLILKAKSDKIDKIASRQDGELANLDDQIAEANAKLNQYKRLDPNLLAEYRKLKDDFDCQQMLIAISEANNR